YNRCNEGSNTVALNSASASGSFGDEFLHPGVSWVPGLFLRPAILTKTAASIASVSATLNGAANPGLTNTTGWFEFGTSTAYGTVSPAQLLGGGGSNTNFSQSITGLTENVTYHFRAVASNALGPSFGDDRTFIATGTNLLTPRAFHTATLLPTG